MKALRGVDFTINHYLLGAVVDTAKLKPCQFVKKYIFAASNFF